jgi:glycosyltransferase involved in cell wall biosynthesis
VGKSLRFPPAAIAAGSFKITIDGSLFLPMAIMTSALPISIIIPAYNAAQFIAQTLDAVLAQTFTAFEVIVVNDGSTDQTPAIVESYVQRDDRVQLVNQLNQGVSAARQQGQTQAKGEFIAFLDADDLWLPQNLAVHLRHFAGNPRLGISFGQVEFMQHDGSLTGSYSKSRLHQIEPAHLFYENLLITPSNAVIRRSVFEQVGGFDCELSGTEDQEFFLRTRCFGWQVEGVEEVLVRYRLTSGGISSQFESMEADWLRLREKVKVYAPAMVEKDGPKSYAYFLRYIARRSLRLSASRTIGLRFMQRALKSDWTILLQEPRRTGLTLLAVCCKPLMPR